MGFFFYIRTMGLLMMLTGAMLLCYIPYENLYRQINRLREITQLDISLHDFIKYALSSKASQKCELSPWSAWSKCHRRNETATIKSRRYRLIPYANCYKETDKKPCRCPPPASSRLKFIDERSIKEVSTYIDIFRL
ncbi:hypothetical protein Tcan_07405 [Toxocara canis]|uniref:Uncharacterized protein n=1 Tax=Toxocara canis TaxID=6265 RepID=A0A0B2W499_TOXCA|nr:hypothetical protein Tcan_07405 [Toxocara canis]